MKMMRFIVELVRFEPLVAVFAVLMATAFAVVVIAAVHSSRVNADCEASGGVLVRGYGGYRCVEAVRLEPERRP